MTRFVVHQKATDGPATHALLIGVGHYPHLIGGGGELYPGHDGLRQLSSPPVSACAFAEWLIRSFAHPSEDGAPARPLASVALLAGAVDGVDFTHPTNDQLFPLEAPTLAHVMEAAEDWKKRGDSHQDNMMLFYFCGHGVEDEPYLGLLLQEYGSKPDSALRHAIDFQRFRKGMEKCRARQQCFFVDACRKASPDIIDADGYAGDPIFTPGPHRDRSLPVRVKPAFYATFENEVAQSRTGEVSLFTGALLTALRGGGASNTTGSWWVTTDQLRASVEFLMKRAHERGFPRAQINPVDDQSTVALHCLNEDPVVPVVVGCRPRSLNKDATLAWQRGAQKDVRGPDENDWDVELELGTYEFNAEMKAGAPAVTPETNRLILPPYQSVRLKENG